MRKYPTIQHIENGDADLCFQATLKRTTLIHQFYNSIENIRNNYTEEVYFNQAKLPFPTKEVIQLEELVIKL